MRSFLARVAVVATVPGAVTACMHHSQTLAVDGLSRRAFSTSLSRLAVKRVKRKRTTRTVPVAPSTAAAAVTSVPLTTPAKGMTAPTTAVRASAIPSPPRQPQSQPATSSAVSKVDGEARLVHRLDKMNEAIHQLERNLRVCSEATGLAQRQLAVLDRRLVGLEQATEALQSGLAASQRTMGEVVLEQRNTELLVRQLESRVLQAPLTTATTEATHTHRDQPSETPQEKGPSLSTKKTKDTARSARGDADEEEDDDGAMLVMGEEEWESRVRTLVDEAVHTALASARGTGIGSASEPQGAEVSPAPAPSPRTLATLSTELAELKRQVGALSQQHTTLQRVLPAAKEACAMAGANSTEAVVGAVAATLSRAAAEPFQDVDGSRRPRSAKIVVRNVPRNVSAAEVRALCAAKLNRNGGVVSCTVSQYQLPQSLKSDRVRMAEEDAKEQAMSSAGVSLAPSVATVPIVPNSKTFEVVFDSPETARRALEALNRTALRPAAHLPPQVLFAEPVVSAEFLDALSRVSTTQD